MKIKSDFVTNSSSTSYVLVDSKPKKSSSEKMISIEIKMSIDNFLDEFSHETFKTIEELDEYFEDEYGEDWFKQAEEGGWEEFNLYKKYKDLIEQGNTVIFFYVSNDERGLSNSIYDIGLDNRMLKLPPEIKLLD